MAITLTIEGPLAEVLRKLAGERGVGWKRWPTMRWQQAWACLYRPVDTSTITTLGSLQAVAPTAEQLSRMQSPIISRGPVLPRREP